MKIFTNEEIDRAYEFLIKMKKRSLKFKNHKTAGLKIKEQKAKRLIMHY